MTRQYDIPKQAFDEAWRRVKANHGAAGVDGQSIADFERDLENNLYKIWNRMCSGSYFPPAVRTVEIPKANKKLRKLGIPTVADRVAQMVTKSHIEPLVEPKFHDDSYGYRPGRNQHHAIAKARQRCWHYDWVLEIDIKGFFDNLDHSLTMEVLSKHTQDKWILLYVKRWLEADEQAQDGTLHTKEKGSPQGSVVSPILSNIFLHHAFDTWMAETHPNVPFERFADDLIVHCRSLETATDMALTIANRLNEWKLEINTEKTRIVYCKDGKRRGDYNHITFTFLGFTFKPRRAHNRKTGEIFTSFLPGISHKAQLKLFADIREWRLSSRTHEALNEISKQVNPQIRGWLNYYGAFYQSALDLLREHLDLHIMHWGKRKYERLRKSDKKARKWLAGIKSRAPRLFAHWKLRPAQAEG